MSETPRSRNFSFKLSSPLILMFWFWELDATAYVDLWDVGIQVKVLVSLLNYSIASDKRFETTMKVSRRSFFLPGPVLFCLELCWSLKKMGMHNDIGSPKDALLHLYPECMGPLVSLSLHKFDKYLERKFPLWAVSWVPWLAICLYVEAIW